MIRFYFKQAIQMMRQNSLFTALYIGGTALTLALVTTYAVVFYLRIAPVYPETNRPTSAYLQDVAINSSDGRYRQSNLSWQLLNDHIYKLRSATKISAQRSAWSTSYVRDVAGRNAEAAIKPVDPAFFEVYQFDFLQGAPISQGDFDSRQPVAVVTRQLAREAFGASGEEDAVGRTVTVDFKDYRVVGVVESASSMFNDSFADVYVPYTALPEFEDDRTGGPFLGRYKVVMLTDDHEALRREVDEIVRRINSADTTMTLTLFSQPRPHLEYAMAPDLTSPHMSMADLVMGFAPAILALMLVPALNLSGMISGRMEIRQGELGIRKAFGATRRRLLAQVLWENMFLTLAGGILGLILTWVVLLTSADWLMNYVLQFSQAQSRAVELTPSMLFTPWVFLIMFALAFVLNILSALVPAWNSLRRPIVMSLKEK